MENQIPTVCQPAYTMVFTYNIQRNNNLIYHHLIFIAKYNIIHFCTIVTNYVLFIYTHSKTTTVFCFCLSVGTQLLCSYSIVILHKYYCNSLTLSSFMNIYAMTCLLLLWFLLQALSHALMSFPELNAIASENADYITYKVGKI